MGDDLRERLDRLESVITELAAVISRPRPKFIGFEQAGQLIGVGPDTVRRMVAAGKLTAYRPTAGRVVIDVSELESVVRSTAGTSLRRGRGHRKKTQNTGFSRA